MDRKSAVFIAMGFECVGVILVCIYVGNWLDGRFGWGGLGVAGGALVGLVGWMTHLLIVVRQIGKKD